MDEHHILPIYLVKAVVHVITIIRFFFVLFSFYFHFFFILFSFVLHFFFICVIIFSSFLRCRSPRSSFFLHFVFIFPGGLPKNLHFFFISLPAVLDTGAARGRGTKMQNDEKMMKKWQKNYFHGPQCVALRISKP